MATKRRRSSSSENADIMSNLGAGGSQANNTIIAGSITIENLPNDILSLILNRIELQELVHLRIVSTQWQTVIVDMCQKKLILKLFDRLEETPQWASERYYRDFYMPTLDSEDYERMRLKSDDWLKVKPMKAINSAPFALFMARLFPNVEVLVYGKEFFTRENVNLIQDWPKNLRELTIVGCRLRNGFEDNLCETLNSKTTLRRLNLLFHFIKTKTNIRPLKDTLGQLEGFGLQVHADIRTFLSILGPNCARLQIGRVSESASQWQDKIYFDVYKLRRAMTQSLTQSLTHVALADFYEEKMLEFFYKELVNLQFVGLRCMDYKRDVSSPMDLSSLLNSGLNHAKNLRELKFSKINFCLDYGYGQVAPKDVNSVKILRIDYSGYSCNGFSSAGWCETLAGIFPKLEVLVVKQPYDDGEFEEELEENQEEFKFIKKVKFVDTEHGEI